MQSIQVQADHHYLKHILTLTIFLILVFLTNTGFVHSVNNRNGASAMERLYTDLKQKRAINWKLVHHKDAYQQGTLIPADRNAQQYLKLSFDGKFEMYNQREKYTGKWKLDRATRRINFHCEKINCEEIIGDALVRSFRLKTYTHNSLTLSWQGRHGWVDIVYRVAEPERSMIKLPFL